MNLNFYEKDIYAMELTDENGRITYLPVYTCGHCSQVVGINKDRVRPRNHCLSCNRLICDVNGICNSGVCVPLPKLARDHFEGGDRWVPYVNAIMKGATTLDEVEQLKGVVNG